MNHTIKGIILVVAITSMLFVGATSMFPTMQNSFAHKKSAEARQAEGLPISFPGVPGGNTNTNTNTADSSSTSSATADNTNNITNSATATQSQEQSACAVALTCSQGSTTVTLTSTCNPSTVSVQIATRSDGTCAASIPRSAGDEAVRVFEDQCVSIPTATVVVRDTAVTCLFESPPPA